MGRKLINTKNISHDEWIELRKNSIGGSDAAVCVDMNEYSSKIALYADKMGLTEPKEPSEAMRLGTDLEEYVAKRYVEQTGNKVRNDNFMYLDDEYDFISANVDRVLVGQNGGLECKTMSSFGKYNLEAGEIPAHYFCQCQHYMMVMGFDFMDLAILVLQKGIYINRINRDNPFISSLREAEIDFWMNYIAKEIIPAPDGSDSAMELLQTVYPTPKSEDDMYIPSIDGDIKRIYELEEFVKMAQSELEEHKQKVCAAIGVGGVAVGDSYGASWKVQTKSGIDTKRLKEELPDVYAKYVKVSEYPVFRKKQLKLKNA